MTKSLPDRLRERAGVLDDYAWHAEVEMEAADYIEKLEEVLALAGKMNLDLMKELMECAEREKDRGPRSPDR